MTRTEKPEGPLGLGRAGPRWAARERTRKAMNLWLVVGGCVGWVLGCRYLLDLWQVQADHRERMAELSTERARLDDEIEQRRADRARSGRVDQAAEAGDLGDTCRVINWPTLDVHDGWSEEPSLSVSTVTAGRHALSTASGGSHPSVFLGNT